MKRLRLVWRAFVRWLIPAGTYRCAHGRCQNRTAWSGYCDEHVEALWSVLSRAWRVDAAREA